MFPLLGDAKALDEIRSKNTDLSHCKWLMRDPNACEALYGVDGIEEGSVCPHNIYHHKYQVFANREDVADTVERIFRLLNSAQVGVVSELTLDPLSVTELLAARSELDRQSQQKQKQRDFESRRQEAEVNQKRFDSK